MHLAISKMVYPHRNSRLAYSFALCSYLKLVGCRDGTGQISCDPHTKR